MWAQVQDVMKKSDNTVFCASETTTWREYRERMRAYTLHCRPHTTYLAQVILVLLSFLFADLLPPLVVSFRIVVIPFVYWRRWFAASVFKFLTSGIFLFLFLWNTKLQSISQMFFLYKNMLKEHADYIHFGRVNYESYYDPKHFYFHQILRDKLSIGSHHCAWSFIVPYCLN